MGGDVDLLSVMSTVSVLAYSDRAHYEDSELVSLTSLILSTSLSAVSFTPSANLTTIVKLDIDKNIRKRLQEERGNVMERHGETRDNAFHQTCTQMPILASLIEEVLHFYLLP